MSRDIGLKDGDTRVEPGVGYQQTYSAGSNHTRPLSSSPCPLARQPGSLSAGLPLVRAEARSRSQAELGGVLYDDDATTPFGTTPAPCSQASRGAGSDSSRKSGGLPLRPGGSKGDATTTA